MAGALRAELLRRRTEGRRPGNPVERPTVLELNGGPLVTLQTTPVALDDWALGFLFAEGIVTGPGAIEHLTVEPDGAAPLSVAGLPVPAALVRVEARPVPGWRPDLAGRRYLTSGCGRGVTFSSVFDAMSLRPVRRQVAPGRDDLAAFAARMQAAAQLYEATGGMHSAALVRLVDGEMVVREDIGRHNAADKAIGAALRRGWDPAGLVFLTSGRISYEMCAKLGRFGVAVGASLTAATDLAVRLAARLGITLVGYLGRRRPVVYTGGEWL